MTMTRVTQENFRYLQTVGAATITRRLSQCLAGTLLSLTLVAAASGDPAPRGDESPEVSVFSSSLRFEGEEVGVARSGRTIRKTAIHRGKRFNWVRQVSNRLATPEARHQSSDSTFNIDDMTVADLAEAMRALMLFGDHEFVEAEPAWDSARRLKLHRELELAGISKPLLDSLIPSGSPSWSGSGDAERTARTGFNKSVHGVDDRNVMSNTSYPHSAQVVFDNTSTGSGIDGSEGSGTLIGSSTIMSVAHVFWDEANDDWEATHRWAPGFDSNDADSSPFGDWVGCYLVAIPTAYTNNISQNDWDYAVIDTDVGCNNIDNGVNSDEPGSSVGWLGWYTASTSDIEGNTGYVRGYPGVGTCGNPGQACGVRVWGDISTSAETDRVAKEIRHQADTSGGMSGSGFYIYEDPSCGGCDYGAYVVGMHRAGSVSYNVARRLGSRVATFIEDNSSDF